MFNYCFTITLLVYLVNSPLTTCQRCHDLWYNECTTDGDCCSSYCDRPEAFKYGVCKPVPVKSMGGGVRCFEDDYNRCKENPDCCSGVCERPASWKYGVCRAKVSTAKPPTCYENWYNQCVQNSTCCSKFCDRPADFEFGVCKPLEKPSVSPNECKPLFYNECTENADCCSKYCDKGPNQDWKLGVCKNETTELNGLAGKESSCHELWFNGCKENDECCSEFCFMGEQNNWEFGVCKWPENNKHKISLAKSNETKHCKPLWNNQCVFHAECCTGYCYKGAQNEWALGVCKTPQLIVKYSIPEESSESPESITPQKELVFVFSANEQEKIENCTTLNNAGCKETEDCCVNKDPEGPRIFCDRGPDRDWKLGVCKLPPYTTAKNPKTGVTQFCLNDWNEACLSNEECCSRLCYQDATWRQEYGVCMPVKASSSMMNQMASPRRRLRLRQQRSTNEAPKMICYIGTWANYKPDKGKFTIEDIDANICTHLVYGFAKLDGNQIKPFDPWLDLPRNESGGELDAYARFNALKKKNPELKTIISIGGWNEGSIKYSQMAANGSSRQEFARSVLAFLDRYGFDGLELDWEYPGTRGGDPSTDKDSFTKLIFTLSSILKSRGYGLSIAVAANPRVVRDGYEASLISRYVDFITVLAYDYHGAFDAQTGHNAPLFARPDDPDRTFNINYGLRYWLDSGVPPSKLILGMPLYGRVMKLASPESDNSIGAPLSGVGEPGRYSGEPGAIYFREICELVKADASSNNWTLRWDSNAMVPTAVNGDQWITFDNAVSLKYKTILAQKLGLAGVMVWSMESDDFQNTCEMGVNPLLNAIRETLDNPLEFDNALLTREKRFSGPNSGSECTKLDLDSMPIVSQLRSLWTAFNGDVRCAKATQESFARNSKEVSQSTSPNLQTLGNTEHESKKTQLNFFKQLHTHLDGTMAINHLTDGIHFAIEGDKEKGDEVFSQVLDKDVQTRGQLMVYGTPDSSRNLVRRQARPGEVLQLLNNVLSNGLTTSTLSHYT